MRVFITSETPAAVSIHGECFFRAGTDKTVFDFDDASLFTASAEDPAVSSAIITLTPPTCSGLQPLCAELAFSRSGSALSLSASGGDDALSVVDWSGECDEAVTAECCFELIIAYPQNAFQQEPKLLDKLEFKSASNESADICLYIDCGLRLNVRKDGIEKAYVLCEAEGGNLRALDVGSEMLLAVHAKGCISAHPHGSNGRRCERLFLFNEQTELVGEVRGDACFIEDGYLTVINELGTVLAHQQRIRYELTGAQMRAVGRDFESESGCSEDTVGEIGFFTRNVSSPANDGERALALMECILLLRENEAMALLSPALGSGLDLDGLCAFFGDFDEARIAPFSDKSADPIIGAIKDGAARAYSFEFENGLISDISELEPPYLRHAPKREKASEE